MWGYKIIKKTERLFGIKIRHGALYPLLNSMESKGYVRSKKTTKRGRVRKVYEITSKR
jgi:DNA-binding PadR family transcriptional regulator